jgi:hypothetical protein
LLKSSEQDLLMYLLEKFCRVVLSGAAIFNGTPDLVLGNLTHLNFEYVPRIKSVCTYATSGITGWALHIRVLSSDCRQCYSYSH